jgi:hypothetical protein
MDQLGGISENWPTTDLARGQGNVIEDGLRDGIYVTEGASPAITGALR